MQLNMVFSRSPEDKDQGILLFVPSHGNVPTNIPWVGVKGSRGRALLAQLAVFGQRHEAALTLIYR